MAKIFDMPFAVNGDREVVPTGATTTGRVSFSSGFGPDYEKDLDKDPTAKDIERKKLNYLFYVICDAINKLADSGGSVVGVPIPYPSLTVPEGYVPYDGRRFDTSSNPKLAALFPNGYLPDLRGLVIRGLDAGRGLDPNRGILTYQEDAIRNITGLLDGGDNPKSQLFGEYPVATGCFRNERWVASQSNGADQGRYGRYNALSFDASRVVPTAQENRMKNLAFYYITKVG